MLHREGINCDSSKKDNIRGKRYKCVVCYDYPACCNCYKSAASSSHHSSDDPMQCLFPKRNCELLFGSNGDANSFKNNFAANSRNRTPRNQNKQLNSRALVNGQPFGDDIIMDSSPSRSSKSAPQAVPQTKNFRRVDKVQSLPYYAGAKFSDPPPPNSLPMPPQHWITRSGDH